MPLEVWQYLNVLLHFSMWLKFYKYNESGLLPVSGVALVHPHFGTCGVTLRSFSSKLLPCVRPTVSLRQLARWLGHQHRDALEQNVLSTAKSLLHSSASVRTILHF